MDRILPDTDMCITSKIPSLHRQLTVMSQNPLLQRQTCKVTELYLTQTSRTVCARSQNLTLHRQVCKITEPNLTKTCVRKVTEPYLTQMMYVWFQNLSIHRWVCHTTEPTWHRQVHQATEPIWQRQMHQVKDPYLTYTGVSGHGILLTDRYARS